MVAVLSNRMKSPYVFRNPSCDFTIYGGTGTATGDSDNSGYLPPISGGHNTATTAVTLLSITPTGKDRIIQD